MKWIKIFFTIQLCFKINTHAHTFPRRPQTHVILYNIHSILIISNIFNKYLFMLYIIYFPNQDICNFLFKFINIISIIIFLWICHFSIYFYDRNLILYALSVYVYMYMHMYIFLSFLTFLSMCFILLDPFLYDKFLKKI